MVCVTEVVLKSEDSFGGFPVACLCKPLLGGVGRDKDGRREAKEPETGGENEGCEPAPPCSFKGVHARLPLV